MASLADKIASELSLHRKSLKLGKWIVDYYKTADAVRAGMASMATATDRVRLVAVTIACVASKFNEAYDYPTHCRARTVLLRGCCIVTLIAPLCIVIARA